ncbi:MAG: hypothetical protein ACRDM0_07970 [Thermoleophilaceae bacterium]
MTEPDTRALLGRLDEGRQVDHAEVAQTSPEPLRTFLLAIAARRGERFRDALALFRSAATVDLPEELARRTQAEIAHLLYYEGRFDEGVATARQLVRRGPRDLSRAIALVALSVNELARNDARAALRSANEALLEMRMLGAPLYQVVNVKLQLLHVTAQMGRADEAVRVARQARSEAQEVADPLQQARSEYGLGYALWAAGDHGSIDHFIRAEQLAHSRTGSLRAWIVFCLACSLRDFGFTAASEHFLAASSVNLRHERAWFDVRGGDVSSAVRWLTLPIARDEIPFLRSVAAAVRLTSEPRKAASLAAKAAGEFGRLGLHHYRRGAEFIEVGGLLRAGEDPTERLTHLISDLERAKTANWAFFEPALALECLAFADRRGIGREHARQLAASIRVRSSQVADEATLLLARPRLLSPAALRAFRDAGLTNREIWVAVQWLQSWLEGDRANRAELAGALAMSDASLRAHINAIRSKLALGRRRGLAPLLGWLLERELLTDQALADSVRALLRRTPSEGE